MNREVHVRIWERPEVRVLRATRQFETPKLLAIGGMADKTHHPAATGARPNTRGPYRDTREQPHGPARPPPPGPD
jgi:hypothetical protein